MVALLACAPASCAAPPPERFLRLDAVAVTLPALARPVLTGDLQLLPFSARGLLAERQVVYLEPATGDARPAAALVWEDGPATAVARVTARVLQAGGLADAVLAPDERSLAAFWLDGRIERFELVTSPGRPEQAVVQLEFTVLAGQARRPALIARYCRAVPTGSNRAAAFSRAVSVIGAALAADIVADEAALNAAAAERAVRTVKVGQQIGGGDCGGDA